MRRQRTIARWTLAGALLGVPFGAFGFGPEGHLIAGIAAERNLCPAARDEVAALGEGEDLGELGLWADRIRDDRAYRQAAPWHYVNIAAGESLSTLVHPKQGDVLWAIERFKVRLADRSLPPSERAEALKFLVHFIADVHQPLHVTLIGDRGGNAIDIRTSDRDTNLHRFWDSETIALADLSVGQYARSLRAAMQRAETAGANLDPVAWAEESLALRATVYDFEAGGSLSGEYVERSLEITRERLALAALRLAGTLNSMFCSS